MLGPCLMYSGGIQGLTPVISYNGKVTPVRRVLLGHTHGFEIDPLWRIKRCCLEIFCVNPHHSIIQVTSHPLAPTIPRFEPPPEPVWESLSPDDCIDMILSIDERSPAALAERFDEPVSLIEAALAKIEADGL